MIKTRFAPSPTGLIHLGNMRTALFNALIAHHQKGIFLLRIEDTDEERSEPEYIEYLKEDMRWLGVTWEEGEDMGGPHMPYRQSERHAIYHAYYEKLIEKGLAYPCFCSEEQLKLSRKLQRSAGEPPRYDGRCARLSAAEVAQKMDQGLSATLRFRIPKGAVVRFNDAVQGEKVFKTDDLGDFIIRRADKTPSFMFCNAIDDAVMGVTHAFRGEDHLTNTPRQLLILQALELPAPQYGHFALINGTDGAPLSKRNGSQSIRDMRLQGYFPEAVTNYLARLGHYYAENELMSLSLLAERFHIEQLGRSPARFDPNQLMFFQKEALKVQSTENILAWMGEATLSRIPEKRRADFVELTLPNTLLPQDALVWAERAYADSIFELLNQETEAILTATPTQFFDVAIAQVREHGLDWERWVEGFRAAGYTGKALFQPIRIALMGTLHGPEIKKWILLMDSINHVEHRFEQAKHWILNHGTTHI